MIKQITPSFPDQKSINNTLQSLSPEARASYDKLKLQYEAEIGKSSPDHEIIAKLISKGSELVKQQSDGVTQLST